MARVYTGPTAAQTASWPIVQSSTAGYGAGAGTAAGFQRGAGQQTVAPQQDTTGLQALIQGQATAAGGYTRANAIADTTGLVGAANRNLMNSILPQITGAQEGAGASGGALTALLAQNATAAEAGQVAREQLAAIGRAVTDQGNRHGQSLTALDALLANINNSNANRATTQLGYAQISSRERLAAQSLQAQQQANAQARADRSYQGSSGGGGQGSGINGQLQTLIDALAGGGQVASTGAQGDARYASSGVSSLNRSASSGTALSNADYATFLQQYATGYAGGTTQVYSGAAL